MLLFATQPAAGFYLTAPGRHCDRKFNADELQLIERYFRQNPHTLLVTRRKNLDYVARVFPEPIVVEEIQPVPAFLRPYMRSNKSLLVALIPRKPVAENR